MSVQDDELTIPPDAYNDPDSWEILRLWGSKGEQLVSISSQIGGGPDGFGRMLAHLARHGANLFKERDDLEISDSMIMIRDAFDDEWNSPTETISGEILK